MAERGGDRADDDERGGGTAAANPNSTGRCSCSFAVGHACSQGGVVLSPRMWFSIRRHMLRLYHRSDACLVVEDEPFMAEAIRHGLRLEAIAATSPVTATRRWSCWPSTPRHRRPRPRYP